MHPLCHSRVDARIERGLDFISISTVIFLGLQIGTSVLMIRQSLHDFGFDRHCPLVDDPQSLTVIAQRCAFHRPVDGHAENRMRGHFDSVCMNCRKGLGQSLANRLRISGAFGDLD
jgi:hypothetical protein